MRTRLFGAVAAFALLVNVDVVAYADTFTFTDNFSPQQSPLWSNSIGNWTSSGGGYFAQAPSNSPETYTGLPFDFTNSNFSLTVTINGLRFGSIPMARGTTGSCLWLAVMPNRAIGRIGTVLILVRSQHLWK